MPAALYARSLAMIIIIISGLIFVFVFYMSCLVPSTQKYLLEESEAAKGIEPGGKKLNHYLKISGPIVHKLAVSLTIIFGLVFAWLLFDYVVK